jgi:hypothetical protein
VHANRVQHIVESFRQRLQLRFKLHLNQKFAQEVMALQSLQSPKFLGQNDI